MTNCKCPVCKRDALYSAIKRIVDKKTLYETQYLCPHCGSYILPNDSILSLVFGSRENYFPLICYLYETKDVHDINHPIRLNNIELERVSKMIPLSVEEKIDRILTYLNTHSPFYGSNISLNTEVIYSKKKEELDNLIQELLKQNYVDNVISTDSIVSASISLKGIEKLKQKSSEESKDSCFIAMWFSPEMNDVYEKCIIPACLDAGYRPVRVDNEQFNGDITDKIIASIRTTHFTIADLTGYRGGVYYEAGFAKGLGKEVVLTCRNDWFDGDPKENRRVHFDVNHLSIIKWEDSDIYAFRQMLKERIVATVGQGTFVDKTQI